MFRSNYSYTPRACKAEALQIRLRLRHQSFNIMVTDRFTDRVGVEPILSVKRFVTVKTMRNFDGNGNGGGTCNRALQRLKNIFYEMFSCKTDDNGVCSKSFH